MTSDSLVPHYPKCQKSHYLQLLKPLADGRQELLWHRDMPGGGRNIMLAAIYDSEHLVVAEESGRIYRANLDGELALVADLPVNGIRGAGWLGLERQRFWYAAELDIEGRDSCRLLGWSLPDWQPIADIELPDYIQTDTLTSRSDGALLFYQHDFEGEHGFFCTDPASGQTRYHRLPSKPMPDVMYPMHRVALCPKRDLALLPAVGQLPLDGSGDDMRLGYQLQLVDLKTFEILWCQTIRYFPLSDLDDADELLALAKGEGNDAEGALEDFVETLGAIRFCPEEDAFWVKWGDSAVQKISLDGRDRRIGQVANYRLEKKAGILAERPNPLATFGYKNYDYGLLETSGCLPTIGHFGVDVAVMDSAESRAEPDGWQRLFYCECPEPELVMADTQRQAQAMSGKIEIAIDYLPLPECRLQGAQQLREVIQDVGKYVKGQRLQFLFTDNDDRQRTEAEFTQMAIDDPGVAEVLAEAVQLFNAHPDAPIFRSDDSKAALSDTVLALAAQDIKYLPLIAQYLNAIDSEHCATFHMEHTLPLIEDKYGQGLLKSKAYKAFNRALPWPFNGEEY